MAFDVSLFDMHIPMPALIGTSLSLPSLSKMGISFMVICTLEVESESSRSFALKEHQILTDNAVSN